MLLEPYADVSRAASIAARLVALVSGGALQQFPGLALQFEAGVLMGLGAGERRDARHEIEDALCRAADYAEQTCGAAHFPTRSRVIHSA